MFPLVKHTVIGFFLLQILSFFSLLCFSIVEVDYLCDCFIVAPISSGINENISERKRKHTRNKTQTELTSKQII